MGKITLPLLYGLTTTHKRRDELQQLLESNRLSLRAHRVRDILNEIHTQNFIIWVALQEREKALEALLPCPGHTGVTALTAYATVIFAQVDTLLSSEQRPFSVTYTSRS